MQWQVGFLVVAACTGLSAWSPRAVAQGATDVAVVFESTAGDLPQAAIRDAIGRELGVSPERTVVAARRELVIGVEGSYLVVRFSSAVDHAERRVARPADARQIPELLSLLAGNLARDQRPLVEPPAPVPAREVRTTAATDLRPSAAATPGYRHHWFGLHVAQDWLWNPNAVVCDPSPNTAFSCFDAGTNTQYRPSADSSPRRVVNHFSAATTRVLAAYDYAFTPVFSVGGRAGFAFRGGPNAAASSGFNPHFSESAGDLGDQPFYPLHLEAHANYWFAPLTNERLRGFLGVGAGVMQVDAKASYVVTCGLGTDPSDGCGSPRVLVDAWHRVGRGFVDLRFGTELRLWDELGLELDVNAVTTFPAFGFVLEPSLGVVYAP
ncbi:MAG TPA: hypothetical protein VMI54_15420 [Polyangiaceae bacterium]|nr:hypothetical protein [Polyangiaceae bacterium]